MQKFVLTFLGSFPVFQIFVRKSLRSKEAERRLGELIETISGSLEMDEDSHLTTTVRTLWHTLEAFYLKEVENSMEHMRNENGGWIGDRDSRIF